MFSPDHFIWIGIVIGLILLLTFLSSKFKWSYKTATIVIFVIFVVTEIFKIATHMTPGSRWVIGNSKVDGFPLEDASYLLQKSLPFQLCSSMIFFLAYLVFGKDEKKKEVIKPFVVSIFLTAGVLAVILATTLNADNTKHLFDSFKDKNCGPIQYFFYHAGMIWYGIYLIRTKNVKFGIKPLRNVIIMMSIVFVFAIWINSALAVYGVNFMFVVVPPAKGLPLLNLNHGWVVYMIHYILLTFLMLTIVQTPAIIRELKARKEAE